MSVEALAAANDVTAPAVPLVKFMALTLATAAVPYIGSWCKTNSDIHPWFYRVVWAIAFLSNMATVSIPGRFDSQQEKGGDVFKLLRTLFEPAPWAFTIWGVIYLGELLLTGYVGAWGQPINALKNAMPAWVAGNLFQSLWCLAFRPALGGVLWLPMSLLALGAGSFALAHWELSRAIAQLPSLRSWEGFALLLMRFPLALHTGWLSAASLLNFNTWIAASFRSMDTQIAIAFVSIYAACIVGGTLTAFSKDPFIAFTIAWALAALADRTAKKQTSQEGSADRQTSADTLGALAKTEKTLSFTMLAVGVGAAVSPHLSLRSMF